MASSASSNSTQHSNDASSCISSSSTQHSNVTSSCASSSSSSRQHSNDASTCMKIELWCDHCAWHVKGERLDDGIICCAFCGKILQDATVTIDARSKKLTQSCKASSSKSLQSDKDVK